MAGHSKWANIKHRKGRQDAKKGKIFSRLIRELTVAAKLGGPIPEDNPRLRTALDKALSANINKDTIDKAVLRGTGGPGGVAIMVESMTNNNNRTVAEVRHAFTKAGGNLGTNGSVSYLFVNKGLIQVNPGSESDLVLEKAIEAGAEDIDENLDGSMTVSISPDNFEVIKNKLIESKIDIKETEITLVPKNSVSTDLETSLKLYKLLEALEDLDDTQNVYSNAVFPDEMVNHLD